MAERGGRNGPDLRRLSARLAWALLVPATMLPAACTATTQENPFAGGGAGSPNSIRLDVQNQQFNEARLTAFRMGGRTRIGTVGGNESTTFTVDWPTDSRLSVEIDLLAGDSFRTRPVNVEPGDRVQLYITQPLYRSYLR